MDTTFIYCLTEPDTRIIRYFGKADDPKGRLIDHIRDANVVNGKKYNYHVYNWIRKVLLAGKRPDLHILCEVSGNDWKRFEIAFIALGKYFGFDLTNFSPGGGGVGSGKDHPLFGKTGKNSLWFGRKHSQESRKKQSEARSGEKNPLFGKTGAQHPAFGLKPTPEKTAKASLKLKGVPKRPECLYKWRARAGEKKGLSSSKFYGVYWKTENSKWQARIKTPDKRISLGYFSNEIDAAKAYDSAARIYHVGFAKLNFPD